MKYPNVAGSLGPFLIPSKKSFEIFVRNLHVVDAVPAITGITPLVLLDLFERVRVAHGLGRKVGSPQFYNKNKRALDPLSLEIDKFWMKNKATYHRLQELQPATQGPLVSIIITTRNRARYLNWTLQGLTQQTYKHFEIFVVDDMSSEHERKENRKVIKSYHHLSPIQYFENKRWLGPSQSRNRMAKLANGEFLLFVDDDNWAYPHQLGALIAAQKVTRAAVVGCWCDFYRTKKDLAQNNLVPLLRWASAGGPLSSSVYVNDLGDTNTLIQKVAFIATGGFRKKIGAVPEDHDLLFRLQLKGYKHVVIPSVLFKYRALETGRLFTLYRSRRLTSLSQHFLKMLKNHPEIRKKAKSIRLQALAWGQTKTTPLAKPAFSDRLIKASRDSAHIFCALPPAKIKKTNSKGAVTYLIRRRADWPNGRCLLSFQLHSQTPVMASIQIKNKGDRVTSSANRRLAAGWSSAAFGVDFSPRARAVEIKIHSAHHHLKGFRLSRGF